MKNKIYFLLVLAPFLCTTTILYGKRLPLNQLKERAQAGEAKAQYNLGVRFHQGKQADKNYSRARFWYKKAAKNGNIPAHLNLARLYDQYYNKPYKGSIWIYRAALRGEKNSSRILVHRYINGRGIQRNYIHAYAWALIHDGIISFKNNRSARSFLESVLSNRETKQARRIVKTIRTKQKNNKYFSKPKPPSQSKEQGELQLGTAFYITSNKLLTNQHVVDNCRTIINIYTQKPLVLIKSNPDIDLALLKGEKGSPVSVKAVDFVRSERVTTYGYPEPDIQAPRAVSKRGSVRRRIAIQKDNKKWMRWGVNLQKDLKEGESGSPVFDLSNNVIGILTGTVTIKETQTTYAELIPAKIIRNFIGDTPDSNEQTYNNGPSTVPILCRANS